MSQGTRRLAAIMFTDMVGYTVLAQSNESLALEVLERHNRLLRPVFPKYQGKEVKAIGDSFLVEFDSALDATNCAIEIQRFLHDYNTSTRDEWKIRLRIGIHLGDVVHQRGDVFGDSVNIASRIEPLAEPEGICISQQVYDQVRNKSAQPMTRLEPKYLKNVQFSVDVYKIVMPWEEPGASSVQLDRKRIAVLPFENISPDPADAYFADGLTEELIDRLSQVKDLKVIARTSVMSYRKKEKKASEIGKELGVGTLIEGSVRKAADRIRVTAQLIDVSTEEHLWSSRYDKNLDDIFDVQSDIASKITSELAGTLVVQQTPRMLEKSTDDIMAYSYFLQARQLHYVNSKDLLQREMQLLERAVQLDPSFAQAYALMTYTYIQFMNFGLLTREAGLEKAKSVAHKALELDPELSDAHDGLSSIAYLEDDNATAEAEAKEALRANPNNYAAYWTLGMLQANNGNLKEATRLLETAHVLDPISPWSIRSLGNAYLYSERTDEALELWTKSLPIARRTALNGFADLHLVRREYELAEETIATLESEYPEEVMTVALRGELEALRGNQEGADKAIQLLGSKFKMADGVENYIGAIKSFMGNIDGFYTEFFRALEKHSQDTLGLIYSPLFEKARRDSRYREVLAKTQGNSGPTA